MMKFENITNLAGIKHFLAVVLLVIKNPDNTVRVFKCPSLPLDPFLHEVWFSSWLIDTLMKIFIPRTGQSNPLL